MEPESSEEDENETEEERGMMPPLYQNNFKCDMLSYSFMLKRHRSNHFLKSFKWRDDVFLK